MTTFQPPFDQRMQTDMSALFKRVATLEQQMVQATSNVASGPAAQPPSANGLLAWNFDLVSADSTNNPGSGAALIMRIVLPALTVTNICVNVVTNGTGLTAGQNLAGIYDSGGTRLGLTADQSTVWAAAGGYAMPLTAPVTVAAGTFYIAVLTNVTGSTPNFACAPSSNSSPAFPKTTAPYRFGFMGAVGTSLPASLALNSMASLVSQSTWVGIS